MSTLPEDAQVFAMLERYLERLQAGETPDRNKLLARYPELAPALDCLEALESLAPPAPPGPQHAGSESAGAVPPAGEPFGDYELLEEIGRGGMGVVYKARQRSLDRVVAVKMILAGHLASPEHVRRFLDEARAAARLRHPNVVPIHEVGRCAGQPYFTMEYIEGRSLQEHLSAGPMDIETALCIIEQVARAVAYLHHHGMVHRDLKPSNIILDSRSVPYVTDFGLAKVAAGDARTTLSGTIVGTPSYMAPEQAAGYSSQAGPAADVYSLGAILYEMLTGTPPFREQSALDTILQVLSRDPAPPRSLNRHIPPALELVCMKCLAKSPEARYPSAQALVDELERFRTGEPLTVRPPNPLSRLRNWTRRQPALAARLAVLLGFLVLDLLIRVLTPLDVAFHNRLDLLLVVGAAAAIGFQRLLRYWGHPYFTCFAWGLFDQTLLFHVLLVGNGAASPGTIVYPMLIVGSALWFRVRLVWFMTATSIVSFWIHVADFYLRRSDLQQSLGSRWDRYAIFTLALVVIGGVMAYLVRRIRLLGRYYGHEFPPDGPGR